MKGLEKLTPKHIIAAMLVGLALVIAGALLQHRILGDFGYGAIVVSALAYVVLRKRFYRTDDTLPGADEGRTDREQQ